MATPVEAFWPTVAQVVPVLGLGVVLEARTSSSKWSLDTPTTLRLLDSLMWGTPLILFAFSEGVALTALYGEPVSSVWATLTVGAITISMSLLILNPALSVLVKSASRPISRLFVMHPIWWLRYRRLLFVGNRLRRTVRKERTAMGEQLDNFQRLIYEEQELLRTLQAQIIWLNDSREQIPEESRPEFEARLDDARLLEIELKTSLSNKEKHLRDRRATLLADEQRAEEDEQKNTEGIKAHLATLRSLSKDRARAIEEVLLTGSDSQGSDHPPVLGPPRHPRAKIASLAAIRHRGGNRTARRVAGRRGAREQPTP